MFKTTFQLSTFEEILKSHFHMSTLEVILKSTFSKVNILSGGYVTKIS